MVLLWHDGSASSASKHCEPNRSRARKMPESGHVLPSAAWCIQAAVHKMGGIVGEDTAAWTGLSNAACQLPISAPLFEGPVLRCGKKGTAQHAMRFAPENDERWLGKVLAFLVWSPAIWPRAQHSRPLSIRASTAIPRTRHRDALSFSNLAVRMADI